MEVNSFCKGKNFFLYFLPYIDLLFGEVRLSVHAHAHALVREKWGEGREMHAWIHSLISFASLDRIFFFHVFGCFIL